MNGEELDVYFTYGLVLRMPYDKIETLNKLLKENNIKIVYQKASIGKIYIQSPSGNKEGVGFENK